MEMRARADLARWGGRYERLGSWAETVTGLDKTLLLGEGLASGRLEALLPEIRSLALSLELGAHRLTTLPTTSYGCLRLAWAVGWRWGGGH